MVTTTPRPIKIIRDLVKDPTTAITKGSTYDNSHNLPKSFLKKVREKYEGTRLGRQELQAEILDDVPGALWTRDMFLPCWELPDMRRIVVAVDPSGADDGDENDESIDEIGIIAAGLGVDGFYYALDDATCRLGPAGWASRAVRLFRTWSADRLVAEKNFGGAMVASTIRNVWRKAPIKIVTASRGKVVRAEPIAALYEQKKVFHYRSRDPVAKTQGLDLMEDEMVRMTGNGFMGGGSPNRVDALVWAMTELTGVPERRSGTKTVRGNH
jgi:phage terminase large subunit-like protein